MAIRTRHAALAAVTFAAVFGSAGSGPAQTARPTDGVRFAFTQTELSTKQAGGFAGGDTFESFPVVTCRWPDGKTSISDAAARTVKCLPRGARFPVVTGRKWFLLESPIGGAAYPVENGDLSDDVRFVHASKTPGVMSVGPVLLQFGDYSGGARPSILRGGSSVWIYDYRTENGPEVLRISTSTGAVLERTVMPAISRPVCAVNRYGFWMGQDGNSHYPKGVKLGIWYAPPGADTAVLVRPTDDFVFSITSPGRSVDVRVQTPPGLKGNFKNYLWRFTPIRR